MINSRKVKITLSILEVLLIMFQAFVIVIGKYKQYYLIHDCIFYGINYVIIIFLCLLSSKKKYFKLVQLMICLVLLVINTTFFYYMGNENVVVSKSQDNKYEVIFKEYKKMNYETVRLKRRWVIFGKKQDILMGSSKYKTIESGKFKIEWAGGSNAIVTYAASDKGDIKQNVYDFKNVNYISYINVAPSLNGKWVQKDNHNNYFMYNLGEIVYAKDGKLYYYDANNVQQQGTSSIKINGDGSEPSITIVLNSDCTIGKDDLINPGGTITICPITFGKSKAEVYSKE